MSYLHISNVHGGCSRSAAPENRRGGCREHPLTLLVGVATLLSGCSGSDAATDDNFAEALAPLVADFACTKLPGIRRNDGRQFPIQLQGRLEEPNPHAYMQTMKDLTAVGLFTAQPAKIPGVIGGTVDGVEFAPTKAAEPYLRVTIGTLGSQPPKAICIGRGKVDSIENFTAPSDQFGQQVSEVTYKWSIQDIAPWAERAMGADELERVTAPRQHTSTLVLTNKGWIPKSLLP